MIEDISEIDDIYGDIKSIKDIKEYNKALLEKTDVFLKEKLDTSLEQLKAILCEAMKEKAEESVKDLVNIVCFGDYDKIIEDPVEMANFLKEEATKPDNWQFSRLSSTDEEFIRIKFISTVVDDGDYFLGYIFLNKEGQVKHVFFYGD